jgi:hypothetical protein
MADIKRKKGEIKKEVSTPPSTDKIKKPVLKRDKIGKMKVITTHVVESNNQTLSHIALLYYKHATPPYWKYILENNMEVLGGSEKNVRQGMELVIYELPEELKD